MSQDIADMPGIDAAVERFNTMEPSQTATDATNGSNATSTIAKTDTTTATFTATRDSKAFAQPAATDKVQTSVTSSTDTPAAAASLPTAPASQTDKSIPKKDAQPGNEPPAHPENREGSADGKSRFTKAQDRLEKTWEAVNKRKGDLDAHAQEIDQQRLTLERDKAQFEAIRRQAEQPQATPDQALQAAQLRRRDADALRMQAKRAETAGRFDEAQRLNKQADKADSLADELGSYAEELRRNPPASMQQRQQQFDQARKQWTLEACNAYPELGKNGSRLQQVVAQHLNVLSKQDPQLLVHPSMIYHVARLADAQIKATDLGAAAARVPVLEKEAESLRARIKELEASTTPASNGCVSRLSDEPRDDYATLRQAAVDMGPMFR
jgi:hypothetical protein